MWMRLSFLTKSIKALIEANIEEGWDKLFLITPSLKKQLIFSFVTASLSLGLTALSYRIMGSYFSSLTILTVILISLYGGWMMGIAFAVLLSLINDYFFIPPVEKILSSPAEIEHLIIVSIVGGFISLIMSSFRLAYKKTTLAKLEAENSKREAEKANQYKTNFLATVSHEIRTPLNGIIGLSDVLRKSKLSEEDSRFVEMIYNSGKTLLTLINDILDFSKIEAGKMELENSAFAIQDIVGQIFFSLSTKASEKGIHLDYVIDQELPKTIFGDASRISQILYNLVGNSIKFTSVGSIVLRVKLEPLMEDGKIKVLFSVTDTGQGISSDQQKKLFQPFVQLHKTGTMGEPGSGLGLSICRQLLRAMNSEIYVDSRKDEGSRFYFTLIFDEYSEEKIGFDNREKKVAIKYEPAEIGSQFESNDKPLVLIVEDNPTNQATIQAMLIRLGADVTIASNGLEAVDLITKSMFDLVLMDCQMPVMDGFEATVQIREKKIYTPIIALTANTTHEDQRLCYDAGMNGFLSKPLTIDVLRDKIMPILKPELDLISYEILDELTGAIGNEGCKKVIQVFLSGLGTMNKDLGASLEEDNLVNLKKIGHKYKSSAHTVGALGLATLFRKLENCKDLKTATKIVTHINSVTKEIEIKLKQFKK